MATRFDDIFAAASWEPIPGCPGRFVLRESNGTVDALIREATFDEHRSTRARDVVLVAAFSDGGGLISYRRGDDSVLHTLNTDSGFARKLAALGLHHTL